MEKKYDYLIVGAGLYGAVAAHELKKKAYGNEFTEALKFYNENKDKFDELNCERKITLQNTLINKFHKEVRNLSKGKDKNVNH